MFNKLLKWLDDFLWPYDFELDFLYEPKGINMNGSIAQMTDGRFALLDGKGEVVTFYNRRRDAVRGASRRGLNLA